MKRFHWKDCTNSSLQGEVVIMSVLAAELVSRSFRDLCSSPSLLDLGSRGIAGFQANWDLSEAWPMSLAPTNGDIRCQRVKNLSKKTVSDHLQATRSVCTRKS